MKNILSRYPNFFVLIGQFPLSSTQWQPKQLQGLLLQMSALIEVFLTDEALLIDIADTPKQEANLLLEFAKGSDSILHTLVKMIPLANIKDIEDTDLQKTMQDFIALTHLYIARNKEVISSLENICEDTTDFIRRHPATYQRLLEAHKKTSIAQTFDAHEFENAPNIRIA
jgi:hypothetical protein